jgi:hypothetical protein
MGRGIGERIELNALPNFITAIDGLDIHFIHVRSKHENALPMIVTHGWPGSIIEQLKIIPSFRLAPIVFCRPIPREFLNRFELHAL